MKAAERTGCEISGTAPNHTWAPLEVNGQMRIDVDGLDTYLKDCLALPDQAELAAIQRLRVLARRP